MKLSKQTVEILKNFSTINSNIVIKPGNKISTVSSTKDILAEFESEDTFDKEVSIFNLNELLGAYDTFKEPEILLDDKFLTIKQGKQQIVYVYHDKKLLVSPTKDLTMPPTQIKLSLSNDLLSRIRKISSIFSVEDMAIVGDGKTISVKVFDKKNPTSNVFNVDLDIKTKDTFNINFKIEKLRLFASNYDVEITSRISKWTSDSIKLVVFVAVESDSTFK